MGAGGAFVGMSAACEATMLALIAKSAAPPSNNVFKVAPKTDASQVGCGIIQEHAVVFGCHRRATTRSKLTLGSKVGALLPLVVQDLSCPLGQSTVFQNRRNCACVSTNQREGRRHD